MHAACGHNLVFLLKETKLVFTEIDSDLSGHHFARLLVGVFLCDGLQEALGYTCTVHNSIVKQNKKTL